jgi:hypothetical protein
VDVLVVEAEALAADARWLDSLRMQARPDEPFVLGLASAATDAALEPLMAAGVDEFLVAPFTPSEVRARRLMLERRGAALRQRRSSEEAARGEMERLSAIIQTQADVALAGLDLDELMRLLCERAQMLCGADGAAVGLMDGEDVQYRVATGSVAQHRGRQMAAVPHRRQPAARRGGAHRRHRERRAHQRECLAACRHALDDLHPPVA